MIPKHIAECFVIFGEAFPKWEIRESTIAVWSTLLADVPEEALKRAAIQFSRTSKFPPTIAELRALARGGSEVSAEEAWEIVYAREDPPNEPAQRALRAIGGWSALRSMLTSAMPTIRAQFMRFYDSYLGREREDEERESAETLEAYNQRDLEEIDTEELRQIEESS